MKYVMRYLQAGSFAVAIITGIKGAPLLDPAPEPSKPLAEVRREVMPPKKATLRKREVSSVDEEERERLKAQETIDRVRSGFKNGAYTK